MLNRLIGKSAEDDNYKILNLFVKEIKRRVNEGLNGRLVSFFSMVYIDNDNKDNNTTQHDTIRK